MGNDYAILLNNISKKYEGKPAINNISFNVKKGEIFGLLGHNGAGKTTTLRIISGIIEDYNGEVFVNGTIGYLPEERGLYNDEKVIDILNFFGELYELPKNIIKERINYYLNKLNVEEYRNKKLKTLSKGNQQKIQFIVSILHNPDILILDEPFTGLDVINLNIIKEIIYDFKKEGKSIILSSHQLDKIEKFCDRILILKNGSIVKYGELNEICDKIAYIEYLENNNVVKVNLSYEEGLKLLDNENIKRNLIKFESRNSLEELFLEGL